MQNQYRADPTSLDGYCFFVFALLWRNVGNVEKARFFLIESIKLVPLNWSAWLTLAELITNKHEVMQNSRRVGIYNYIVSLVKSQIYFQNIGSRSFFKPIFFQRGTTLKASQNPIKFFRTSPSNIKK